MKSYPNKCWSRQALSCVRSSDLLALLGDPALLGELQGSQRRDPAPRGLALLSYKRKQIMTKNLTETPDLGKEAGPTRQQQGLTLLHINTLTTRGNSRVRFKMCQTRPPAAGQRGPCINIVSQTLRSSGVESSLILTLLCAHMQIVSNRNTDAREHNGSCEKQ